MVINQAVFDRYTAIAKDDMNFYELAYYRTMNVVICKSNMHPSLSSFSIVLTMHSKLTSAGFN